MDGSPSEGLYGGRARQNYGEWRAGVNGKGLSALARLAPQAEQVDLDGLEGLGPDDLVAPIRREEIPPAAFQPEHLEAACQWIHEPGVMHALAGVHRHLARPIVALVVRRDDLAHPIGGEGE